MNVRITRGNKTANLTGLDGQGNIHRTKSAKDSMEGRLTLTTYIKQQILLSCPHTFLIKVLERSY